jgi:transposase
MFAAGVDPRQVAARLEVSTKSAYTWRQAWAAGGEQALVSKGPSGPDRVLSEAQVAKLVATLKQGPAVAGWVEDQRWTLSRVRTLIGRMFHKTVALSTVWCRPFAFPPCPTRESLWSRPDSTLPPVTTGRPLMPRSRWPSARRPATRSW